MGFAALVNTTLFNTVLLPTKFGELGSDIPQMKLGEQIQTVNTDLNKNAGAQMELDCKYTVKVKIGAEEVTLTNAASVSGLTMVRTVEKKPYFDYTAVIPGNVSYGMVTIAYTYSKESTFVNWLKAGLESGAGRPVNLLLEFAVGTKKLVLVLEDAYLCSWSLGGELNSSAEVGTVLKENLSFNYSGISITNEVASGGVQPVPESAG